MYLCISYSCTRMSKQILTWVESRTIQFPSMQSKTLGLPCYRRIDLGKCNMFQIAFTQFDWFSPGITFWIVLFSTLLLNDLHCSCAMRSETTSLMKTQRGLLSLTRSLWQHRTPKKCWGDIWKWLFALRTFLRHHRGRKPTLWGCPSSFPCGFHIHWAVFTRTVHPKNQPRVPCPPQVFFLRFMALTPKVYLAHMARSDTHDSCLTCRIAREPQGRDVWRAGSCVPAPPCCWHHPCYFLQSLFSQTTPKTEGTSGSGPHRGTEEYFIPGMIYWPQWGSDKGSKSKTTLSLQWMMPL